LFDEQIHLD